MHACYVVCDSYHVYSKYSLWDSISTDYSVITAIINLIIIIIIIIIITVVPIHNAVLAFVLNAKLPLGTQHIDGMNWTQWPMMM